MRRLFILFPLLFLPVLIYNIVAISAGSVTGTSEMPILAMLDITIFEIPMMSGGRWLFQIGHGLLLLSLIMLFIEILKSTSTKSMALLNHALSMGLLLICLVEFLLFKNFATSVFFLITVMVLLDVLAGFMVTVVSARRDFGVGDGIVG